MKRRYANMTASCQRRTCSVCRDIFLIWFQSNLPCSTERSTERSMQRCSAVLMQCCCHSAEFRVPSSSQHPSKCLPSLCCVWVPASWPSISSLRTTLQPFVLHICTPTIRKVFGTRSKDGFIAARQPRPCCSISGQRFLARSYRYLSTRRSA